MKLPYTLCFCVRNDEVLVLRRSCQPNAGLYNGVGGKIEPGETAEGCIHREMLEETGIELARTGTLRYGGDIWWRDDPDALPDGCHVYLLEIDDPAFQPRYLGQVMAEGILQWRPLVWLVERGNSEVVSNIPIFLPVMLRSDVPLDIYFTYSGDIIQGVSIRKSSELDSVE